MWNPEKKDKEEEKSIADSTSFFAKGFKFKGDIDAHSDIRIDGIIEGNIVTSKKVFIGPSGSVIGNVNATNIFLMGAVSGGIFISGMASIGETAKINGCITADKLHIVPGAVIEASVKRFSTQSDGKMNKNTVKNEIKINDEKAKSFTMA